MVAVKESIPCKQMPSPSWLDIVTVTVGLSDPLILSLIYSPPNASVDFSQFFVFGISREILTSRHGTKNFSVIAQVFHEL